MIIHSPIVSGSLTFANGATFTLPTGGVYSGSFSGSYQGANFAGGTFTGDGSGLTFGGTGIVSGSSQLTTEFDARYLNTSGDGIVSSSAQVTSLLPTGIVSGSSQIVSILTPLNTFSASEETKNSTLATYTGSVDTKNTTLGTYTASLETKNSTLATYTGSVDTKFSTLATYTGSIDTTIKTKLNADLVVSGSASAVKTFLSLQNVTNESKETMFTSPSFTGTPVAPTAASNTNSTQIATTAYVQQELTELIGGANEAFDTLLEISASLASGDSTLNTLVSGKLTKSSNLSDLTDVSTARTNLGLAIGTNVQAYNSTLAAVAGGTYSGDDSITTIGTVTAGSVTAILPIGTISGSSQVTLSSTTGGGTSANVQFNSLGIGMAASATAGRIDATNDIVAYSSSDIRFKENITPIENAIEKISKISGNTYDWKAENKVEHGYEGNDVGVIAQEIEEVLPQLVQTRENGYKAVKYDKLVALLIEGIKEQQIQIEELTNRINKLENGL